MARYSKEHRAVTHQRILDEAERILSTEGPEGIMIDQVMQRLGLTHGGFYAHFPSREALIDETVKQMCDGVLDLFLLKTSGHFGVDGLVAYFENYLSEKHVLINMDLCPVSALCGYMPGFGSAAKQNYAQAYAALTDNIASILRKANIKEARPHASVLLAQASGAFQIARALGLTPAAKLLLSSTRQAIVVKLRSLIPSTKA